MSAASSQPRRVAVVGATGAVGREMVSALHRRKFPVGELRLLASGRSAGKVVDTPYGAYELQEYTLEKVADCDVVLMAVSGDLSDQLDGRRASHR